MLLFESLKSYHPGISFFVGLLTFLAFWGIGLITYDFLKIKATNIFHACIAPIVGLLIYGSVVQFISMSMAASEKILVIFWGIYTCSGLLVLALQTKKFGKYVKFPKAKVDTGLISVMIFLAFPVFLNLLLSVAPSTKLDELTYHLLLPTRVVVDGGLNFYLHPWPSSVLAQMIYQISQAPLIAMALPEAANVISFLFSLNIAAALSYLFWQETENLRLSLLMGGLVQTGLYVSVWHVTSGPHAFGDFSLFAAMILLLFSSTLETIDKKNYLLLTSICFLGAAATKISLVPISLVCLLYLGFREVDNKRRIKSFFSNALYIMLPWIVFYCPALFWTWMKSGSPYGPILQGLFNYPLYDRGIEQIFITTRIMNQSGLKNFLFTSAISLVPAISLSPLIILMGRRIKFEKKLFFYVIVFIQAYFIIKYLPHDFRFFGGLIYVSFFMAVVELYYFFKSKMRVNMLRGVLALIIFVCPWIISQFYRGIPLVKVVFGIQNKKSYYRKYIAFYDDFVNIDRILPEDCVLLFPWHGPVAYSPRFPVVDHRDIPADKRAYLIIWEKKRVQDASGFAKRWEKAKLVYQNPQAIVSTTRQPHKQNRIDLVKVWELKKR